MTTICYKTKTPIIYNEGTPNETRADEFLAYYTHKSIEEAQKECDEINTNKPECLWNGIKALCDERYYFVGEQPLFDTKDF